MRLAGRDILSGYAEAHADVRKQIRAWVSEIENAEWTTWIDLKQRFPSADSVGDDRWVFNIKGGNYRLLTRVSFKNQQVRVIDIGTHAEYERWDL